MNSARGISLTAARVLLSLGRDKVLPYSQWFQIVKLGEPVWGLALSLVVALLAGLVQLGSTAAFNSLLGSATIFYELTYGEWRVCFPETAGIHRAGIPVLVMLIGGRRKLNAHLPDRGFNLGKWGVVINLFALFFVVESCVIFCFPATIVSEPVRSCQ